jgi:hypothetical protein
LCPFKGDNPTPLNRHITALALGGVEPGRRELAVLDFPQRMHCTVGATLEKIKCCEGLSGIEIKKGPVP